MSDIFKEWRRGATWNRPFQVEGPIGLREESSRLGLGLEGEELLGLSEVTRGSTGEGDRADLQRWGPGEECALKCLFCFLGWWLGMALGGV